MELKQYESLYKQLNHYDDVERLAQQGLDKELLFVIFTEKHVREVKKNFYHIERHAPRLLGEWKRGKSFTQLAREHRFSPLMMANLLLKAHGWTKKQVRDAMKDHSKVRDERIRKELKECNELDMVYSEIGYQIQYKRGKDGEARIREWLTKHGLTFKEEVHLKAEGAGKTVDFLLDRSIRVKFEEGWKDIRWIESKGSFGDQKKVMRDYTKQLSAYHKMYGPGIVVYWFGFLHGMELWLEGRDVKPVRKEWFENGSRGEVEITK
jgi:hypothetical protein